MGFFDVLAAGIQGIGDLAATKVVMTAAERQEARARALEQASLKGKPAPGSKRKPMPWEKFNPTSPCARGARADYAEQQVELSPFKVAPPSPVKKRSVVAPVRVRRFK